MTCKWIDRILYYCTPFGDDPDKEDTEIERLRLTVTTQSVRDLLDQVPNKHLQDATIQGHIDRCKRLIDNVKDPTAVQAEVDDAIRAMSVWLSYGSYAEGISQDVGSIDIAVKVKLDHFRHVAELFINRISKETIDLATNYSKDPNPIGIPPEVFGLTTSEAYITD